MKNSGLNNKRNKVMLVTTALILVILITSIAVISTANQKIELSVLNRKKLQVVLSKNESNMDVTTFKDDVYTELENLGVDKNLVEFFDAEREEISTTTSDTSTIFNSWGRAGAVGQWRYNASSGIIINYENTDNMTGFYYPDNYDFQDISMKYQSTSSDSDDDAMGGMIRFNLNEDGTYSGYVFLITKSHSSWCHHSGLYKITNSSFHQNNLVLLQSVNSTWARNYWYEYEIEAKGNNIKVYINGNLVVDYTDTNDPIHTGSYGFFSWSQAQSMYRDIKIETVSYKSLKEILLNTTYDSDKIHAIIGIADGKEEELDNSKTKGEILTRTINEQIHYIGLGTNHNKEQMEEFIAENDGNGTYIDNTNYEQAVKETAAYINTLLGEYEENSEYMILGEDATIEVTPSEVKTNTADSVYPEGKWQIIHDHTYYENNIGQHENSGKYISDLPDLLDRVGRFEIKYKDENIDPQYIYVHRRPQAIITLQRTRNNIRLSSELSYDLDKKSQNNGISEVEWSYKEIEGNDWIIGKLEQIEDEKEYLVRLRVKDHQNTWSNYASKYITNQEGIAPIAEFAVIENELTKYETLEIIDTSYSPSGLNITKKEWTIKKDEEIVYIGEQCLTKFLEYGAGEYSISLKVIDEKENESETYLRNVIITEDTIAPEVTANKRTETTINENQEIELIFTDIGGSGFKSYKYAILDINNANEKEILWSEEISENTGKISVKEYGDNYIYLKVKDNEGNEGLIILGKYYIDNKKIQVEIEKVDKDNENIKIIDAQIKIEDELTKTEEGGKGSLSILAKESKIISYDVQETITPVGYKQANLGQIVVQYDEKGNVIAVRSTNSNIVVENFGEEKIKLKIKNEKIGKEGYDIQVEAIDIEDDNIKVSGAKYKIEVNAESGENIVQEQTTDKEGKITIPNMQTKGETYIKITPKGAAKGYLLSDEQIILAINRQEDGTIKVVRDKTSINVEGEIKETNNKENVIIRMPNEKKEKQNEIGIYVLDASDENIKIEDLDFELILPYELGSVKGTTDEEGKVIFKELQKLAKGDHIFTIRAEENNEYNLEEIRIIVSFSEEGIIEQIQELTDKTNNITIKNIEDEKNINVQGSLLIKVSADLLDIQEIRIRKIDLDNEALKLPGVKYKIKQKTQTSIRTTIKSTDSFGEIDIKALKTEKIELTIKELQTISGYVLDSSEKKITLTKNQSTDKMEIDEGKTDKKVIAEVDKNGNITIIEKNERKISSNRDAKANISFFITKKDLDNGYLLGNVEFTVLETTTGRNYELQTDQNGYVELRDFKVPGPGTYEFYITEEKTVTGYELSDVPIKLIITYEEYNGEMKTSAIVVARGYKYIEYKECNEYETDENYQLDVIMTIQNKATGDNELELNKVNEQGKELKGAKYEVKIEYENGTSIKTEKAINELDKLIDGIKFPEGEETTIKLKEVKAPEGYKKDQEERKIVIERKSGGVLTIKELNVRDAYIINNDLIKILIEDEKLEMGGDIQDGSGGSSGGNHSSPGGTSGGNDSIPVKGYNILIVNNNKYNPSLHLEDSKFNLQIKQAGNVKYRSTREIGGSNVASFSGININGEQQIIIQQTVAPEYHLINNDVYTVDIKRDANEEQIQLLGKSSEDIQVRIDNNKKEVVIVVTNEPDTVIAIKKVDAQNKKLKLKNIDFTFKKYGDNTARSEYIDTETYGIGYEAVNLQPGTALYTIKELGAPDGYYPNGDMGIYITTDSTGKNILSASIVENSEIFDNGKCTIKVQNRRYIELEVINERKPEPTYTVIVENRDYYDNFGKIADAEFKVEINQQVGANISTNIITGDNGQARVGGITGRGKIQVKVTQIRAGENYKENVTPITVEAYRTVKQKITSYDGLDYDVEMELERKTPRNAVVSVSDHVIKIVITDIRYYGIQINKVNKEDNDILLEKAKFSVWKINSQTGYETRVGTITTNKNGVGYARLQSGIINQTITYKIIEEEAPEGYKKTGNKKIRVTFGPQGEIINVQLEGSNIKVNNNIKEYISLEIENEPEIPRPEGITLKISKEAENSEKINLPKVAFEIETTSENGEGIRAIKLTDEDGKITLEGIPGKEVEIKLKELETANGYTLDEEERTIKLERIQIGKRDYIKLIQEGTSKDLDLRIDEENKIVVVTIKNKIEEYIALNLVKADANDELKTISGAKYSIKDEEMGELYEVITEKEGAVNLLLKPKKVAGKYKYRIKETQAPVGYTINQKEILLEIEYEVDLAGNGRIKTAQIIEGEEISEIYNQNEKYVQVYIYNEPEKNEIHEYDVHIIKVDRDDIEIKLPGAKMQIDVANSIGQTGLSKTDITDSKGKIEINDIRGAGDVEIDITELVPPLGRKFDAKTKKVKITKDLKTGRLKLVDSQNVDTIIDNTNRIVTVLVRNELDNSNYTIVLEKKDKNDQTINLGNVQMSIQIPGEKSPRTVTTDEQGRIELTNLEIPEKGTYTCTIKEIRSPSGYKILKEEIKYKITFTNEEQQYILKSAEIIKGEKNVEIIDVLPKYVRIRILNEPEETINSNKTYKITLNKVDKDKKDIAIEGVLFGIKILYKNGEQKYIEKETNKYGKIEIDNLTQLGIAEIIVKEKETVYGYDLDATEKTIKVNIINTDDIQIQEKDERLDAITTNNEIKITMSNAREEENIDMHIEKYITKINNTQIDNKQTATKDENGEIVYSKTAGKQTVEYGDIAEFTIRVYNEGLKSGYVKEIFEQIPDGLEYIEDHETNIKYGWEKVEKGKFKTTILSKEAGEDNIIKGYDEKIGLSNKHVKIALRVVEKLKAGSETSNIVTIGKIEDEEGKVLRENGYYKEDNSASEKLEISYVKFVVEKSIQKILATVDGKVENSKINKNGISKVEIRKDGQAEIHYKITIINKGTKKGKLEKIIDQLPEGMEIVKSKSKGWTQKGNNGVYVIEKELEVGESISKTIVLRCSGTNLGTKVNIARVEAKENIGGPSKSVTVVVSARTGRIPLYIGLALASLTILIGGVYLIKKKTLV